MALKWFKRKKRPGKTPEGAYLIGIESLIERDTDRAIEELVKLAKINPDIAETYLALGNLFRAKGDTERAIQVHRSLLHRTGIDKSLAIQAKFNLALDFRKAGFIERAISAFEEVLSDNPNHMPSLETLLELYEDSRDWEKAMSVQEKISRVKKDQDFSNIIAHHLTELAKQQQAEGKKSAALKLYKKAVSKDPNCLDAYLHMGDLMLEQGNPEQAVGNWKKVLNIQPELGYLTFPRLVEAFGQMGREAEFEDFVRELRGEGKSTLYAKVTLARLWLDKGQVDRARRELEEVVQKQPRFWEARILLGKILVNQEDKEKAFEQYSQMLDMMIGTEANFQCQRCGYETLELAWKCPRCRAWDTIVLKPFLETSAPEE